MKPLPELGITSIKLPVSDLAASRRWYADVFGLQEEMEWPDADGTVRGVGFSGLGGVMLALREHPDAAEASADFGFLNVSVPRVEDLATCAAHLDSLDIPHTPEMTGARGLLIGFHDPDRHELSFYAETQSATVRPDAVRSVRAVPGRPGRPDLEP
ncbi:MAG: VOC family protein [Lapillicoccus sp.]